MNKYYILFFALAFTFAACQNEGGDKNTDSADSTSMAQFADDEQFKDAHENPTDADAKKTGTMIEFATADGETGSAYTLMSEKESNDYLFVIHEWWGLNDNIRQEAERLFEELDSVNVMALDIYDGNVAEDRDQAGEYMKAVTEERAKAIIEGAIAKAGTDANISTIGWCFGGGWSLKTSIMAGEQAKACVMYYGMPVQDPAVIQNLQAPVMFILARQDEWITPQVAKDFKTVMMEGGKTLQLLSYDADHAFANPSSPRYVERAASAANTATLAFLKDNMFGKAN